MTKTPEMPKCNCGEGLKINENDFLDEKRKMFEKELLEIAPYLRIPILGKTLYRIKKELFNS